MPLQPSFEETDSLAQRAFRDPKKYAKQLARGLARGMLSAPADIGDLVAQSVPGGQSPGMGELVRALLEKSEATKAEGTSMESIGEATAPMPPIAKAGMAGSLLIGGKRAVNIGALHPDKLADALKEWKRGLTGDQIWRKLGVHVSDPYHFKDEAIALSPIETPNVGYAGKTATESSTAYANRTLEERIRQGSLTGFDDLLKAYPEVASQRIRDVNDPTRNAYGWFDPSDSSVSINHAAKDAKFPPESVVAHELTHSAVQNADNLPRGGNISLSDDVVKRIGNLLARSEGQLSSAYLLRGLLEDTGAVRRTGGFGPADVRDASKLWGASRSATAGMDSPGQRALSDALRVPSSELGDRYDLVMRMNQRMPPNAGVGYRNIWGEAQARRNQGALPLSVAELLKVPSLSSLDELKAVDDELYDLNEYTVQALKKHKLLY